MANVIANTKDNGAISVRIYKNNIPEDIVIGSKSSTFLSLKKELTSVLEANGSRYKRKYGRLLKKAMSR